LSTASPQDVTQLLQAWSRGDEAALDELVPLVYRDLHLRARRCMAGERVEHSLQTTALIHEAYLKLVGPSPVDWESRGHFFAVAARVMRRILVDHARARRSLKRGGEGRPVPLDEALAVAGGRPTATSSRSTTRSRPSPRSTSGRPASWRCATSAASAWTRRPRS
jgi:RNA polymerase sigma factor (TIGR02999 family)